MAETNLNLHLDAHRVPGYVVPTGSDHLLTLNTGTSYRTAPDSVSANSMVSQLHHQNLPRNHFDQQEVGTFTLATYSHYRHHSDTIPPKLIFPVGAFVVLVLAFGLVWYVRQIYHLLARDPEVVPEPDPEPRRLLPNRAGKPERDLEQGVPEVPDQHETVHRSENITPWPLPYDPSTWNKIATAKSANAANCRVV